jgi:hypothetical protein
MSVLVEMSLYVSVALAISIIPPLLVCIVLKTKPVRWFNQKKPEPKSSPVF